MTFFTLISAKVGEKVADLKAGEAGDEEREKLAYRKAYRKAYLKTFFPAFLTSLPLAFVKGTMDNETSVLKAAPSLVDSFHRHGTKTSKIDQ